MNVLLITGDRRFGPGNGRFELQRAAVDELAVVYWGRGSYWPRIPTSQFSTKGGPASGWDVVTTQDPFWRGLYGWIIARRLGARLNVQVHADVDAQSLVKHVLAHIVLRHADSVRVVSNKIKTQVLRIAPGANISVLPIFVDVSKFRSVARTPHNANTILWVGRFEKEKNPYGAVDVFKEVIKTIPDAKLVMLGVGSLEHALKQKAQGLAVEFPGWSDPVPYLAFADAVLSTSWHESFGASIIEALAAGVPVVAPDVGVAKEAGALVAPRTQLAQAVVSVLKEPQQARLLMDMPSADEWKQQWLETL